jgi:hypothetical protein
VNNQQGKVYVNDKRVYATYGLMPPLQIRNGQQVRVDDGRVELLLGLGVYLRMLGMSSIRMQETQLADTRVVLEGGSAVIEITGMTKGAQLHIICGAAVTELKHDGLYRFDLPGEATVEREGDAARVRSGQAVNLAETLELSRFDVKQSDPLQAWSALRIQRRNDGERRRLQARAMQAVRSKAQIDEFDEEAKGRKRIQ